MSRIPTKLYHRLPHRLPPLERYSNYCLYFDRTEDYVVTAAFTRPPSGTLECRARVTQATLNTEGYPFIMGYWGNPTLRIIGWAVGQVFFQHTIAGAGCFVASPVGSFVAGRWTHLRGTWSYDGANTTLALYIGGVLVAGPASWAGAPLTAPDAAFYLAAFAAAPWYGGLLDEVGVLSTPAPIEDGRQSFLQGIAWRVPNSELILRLEEGSGLTAIDTSGKGRDGTLFPALTPPVWTPVRKYELLAEAGV